MGGIAESDDNIGENKSERLCISDSRSKAYNYLWVPQSDGQGLLTRERQHQQEDLEM